MSGSIDPSQGPEITEPKKKGPKVLAVIFVLGMTGFLATLFWINWPKPRMRPEPLNPAITAAIQRMPGKADAIIYIGLKEIRGSRFWKESVPDSLKKTRLFRTSAKLQELLDKNGIDLSKDLDTLLLGFQRSGRKQQKFIGMAWGQFAGKLPAKTLESASLESADIAGHRAYALDSNFWVSPLGQGHMALASSRTMLAGYLKPAGRLLDRDSVSAALIDKAVYKSHLWFALSSPLWTVGALQSLTSGNRDVKSVGNLNKIQQLALSIQFGDGLKGQSEWVYKNRRSAFFASSFLWGTIKLSSNPGTRTSKHAKAFLKHLGVQQNLESVIITADLPMTAFRKVMNRN